jgi:hypothetical protein
MNRLNVPKLATRINKKNDIKINFSGGQITSDGGLILLKKFDDTIGFTEHINNLIDDPRDSRKIMHTQQQLLSQRLYQIIAGYEDCADSNLLRTDPVFKLLAGKTDLEESLGSQPTLSRLENRITRRHISMLKRLLAKQYVATVNKHSKKPLIFDCDSTEDPTHGHQQLSLFSGLFDKHCYHPFLVFEAESQCLVGLQLRPGNAHPARNTPRILAPLVRELKHHCPTRPVIIRGDSSFGNLTMVAFCESHGYGYLFALGNLKGRFDRFTASLLKKAQQKHQRTNKDVVIYSSFWYHSRMWKKSRLLRVQIKVTSDGTETRFLLTNLTGTTQSLFMRYDQRGQCENYIKELKYGFYADRLSCHSFKANFFRLLLHGLAYQLIALFKRLLRNIPELATAQIDTLRIKLFKIGAVLYNKVRWFWMRLSSSWPFRTLFIAVAEKINVAVYAPG